MVKVKLEIRSKSIDQKRTLAQQIYDGMNGNVNFPAPVPDLTTFQNAIGDFDIKRSAALNLRQQAEAATQQQNASLVVMETMMTQLGQYVEVNSGGDAAKIESAGMEHWDPAATGPIGELPAPLNMLAFSGDMEGEIDLDWDSVKGASSYVVQVSPVNTDTWQFLTVVSQSKFRATGLVSGTKYWFRAAAVGTAGQGPWSDPATKMAP